MTAEPPPGVLPASPLTLRTLGGAGLYAAEGSDPILGPGKPLALLIYLALIPGRRTSREFLMDLLWADLDPDRARPALRQTLFHLRRLLGEEALSGTEELTLNYPIGTDRDGFLSAIEHDDLDAAVERYQGAFLPSFGVPGGAAFEHWADLERDRLQGAFLRSCEILVRRYLNQSRFKEGNRLARRARDLVPEAEAAWRLVLEAAITGRDFVSAAVEADAIEQRGPGDGAPLEPATRSLITRARRLTPAMEDGQESFGLLAELTGREREFFAIVSAWDSVKSGPARHLHLSAPAGLGKTRLLRDALARLSAAGARVVQARATPGDREVPYALAGDLALALIELPGAAGVAPASASTLIALNPALSSRLTAQADSASGEEALRKRILALADLVHSVAHEQPFVLAIDDLHWSDHQSYRVLEGLLGRLNGAHLLCLTAARPERLPSGDGVTLLRLAPLTSIQVAGLVSALGSIPPEAEWSAGFVAGLHEATGGSPLLVLETLRLSLDQGMLSLERNEWHCLDEKRLAMLLRAGEALRERVRALPPAQAWVLAVLATAGTPMDAQALTMTTGQPAAELPAVLLPLEQQGLATKTGPGWVPAHDEIAAAAQDGLDPERRAAAERAIGSFYARSAGRDPHRLLRAARHLIPAREDAAVAGIFRDYAELLRSRGDRRPFAQLASEFVAEEDRSPRAAALVRSLPSWWRIGLWSRARQMSASVTLLLFAALALAGARLRRVDDAFLPRLVYADTAGVTTAVAMRAAEWEGNNNPLRLAAQASSIAPLVLEDPDFNPVISPDGASVAWTRSAGDSTTLDIWIRTPTGERRLTYGLGDDQAGTWLPDGSALLGRTFAWTPRDNPTYDIAIFDTATGAARQVTSGPGSDSRPAPSPDGTRIAFLRHSEEAPPMLCLTTLDGATPPECRLVDGKPVIDLLGWSGLTEVLVVLEGGDTRPLYSYDWARKTPAMLLGPHVARGKLSRDRRWVVAELRLEGIRGARDWVIPIGQPARARPVGGPDHGAGAPRWWTGASDASLLIDRIELADSGTRLLPGVGTRLRIRPLTAAGVEVPVLAPVRWSSSDTLVAVVDTSGEVRVHAPGQVTITASLGGWRSVQRTFRVEGEPPVTVFEERWKPDWASRWFVWGRPSPLVVPGPGGIRGFWSHGDGIFPSFGTLRRALTARHGLGAEFLISTPVTRTKWQRMRVALVAGLDTAVMEGSEETAHLPALGRPDIMCGAGFPGEGRWGENQIAIVGGLPVELDLGNEGRGLRSGAWWRLRLQILPDGRCGVAINGRVIWISGEPISLDGEFRLRLGDESAGTRLLQGPLSIWTGVRTDVDWAGRRP